MKSLKKHKYYSALKISLLYLIVSAVYLVFSDKITLLVLGHSVSPQFLSTVQSYKGLAYILIISALFFALIQREINAKGKYIKKLEVQKEKLERLHAEKKEAGKKFESLFKFNPTATVITRLSDGVIREANESYCRLTGYSREELIGKTTKEMPVWQNPSDRERMKEMLIKDGHIQGFETQAICKNGKEIDTLSYLRVVEIAGEKSVIAIILDITEKKHNEKKIRENEKKFRAIFENSLTAIMIADDLGNYLSVNKAAEKIFGYSKKELLNMNVNDLRVSSKEKTTEKYKNYLKKQQETGDFDFINKSGDKHTVLYHAVRIYPDFNLSVMMDITSRKNMEENLKESKTLLEKTLNNLNEVVIVADRNRKILMVNKAIQKVFGFEPKEITGLSAEVLHINRQNFETLAITGRPELEKKGIFQTTYQMKTRDGAIIDCEINTTVILEEDGWQSGIISVIRDISQRIKAEKALRESEANLRTILENAPLIIFTLDKDGKFTYTNWPGFESAKEKPEDLLNNSAFDIYGQLPVILETGETIYGGEAIRRVLSGEKIRGKTNYAGSWLENWFVPLNDREKNILGFLGISLDITQQVQKEKEIGKYQESLKQLTMQVSLAEEKQRKNIAANVHDNLIQLLAVSQMKLKDLKKAQTSETNRNELEKVSEYISEALENSRKITYDLSPPVLYELGLIETMHWLAEKTENEHGIVVLFSSELDELKLSETKLILLYRILQELVNNVIKHAVADKLEISFKTAVDDMLEITVKDNGKGFDTNDLSDTKFRKDGFGLFTVRERINNLDGRFSVRSQIDEGTEVKIYISLKTFNDESNGN